LGKVFVDQLPETARSVSLRLILSYRQPPLSYGEFDALSAALAKATSAPR
jgi:hypothetical protein